MWGRPHRPRSLPDSCSPPAALGTWCGDTRLARNQISYSLAAALPLLCSSGGGGWPKAPEASREPQPLRPWGHSGRSLLGVCGWPPPSAAPWGRWVLLLSQGCALAVVSLWPNFGLLLKCCACPGQNQRVPLFLAPPLTLFFTRSLGQRCSEWSRVQGAPVLSCGSSQSRQAPG